MHRLILAVIFLSLHVPAAAGSATASIESPDSSEAFPSSVSVSSTTISSGTPYLEEDTAVMQANRNVAPIIGLLNDLLAADSSKNFRGTLVKLRDELKGLEDVHQNPIASTEDPFDPLVLKRYWQDPIVYWSTIFSRSKEAYDAIEPRLDALDESIIKEALVDLDMPITKWDGKSITQVLGSYIFMPDKFAIETSVPVMYTNDIRTQFALATSASYYNPLALDYLTKIMMSIIIGSDGVIVNIGRASYTTETLDGFFNAKVAAQYAPLESSKDSYIRFVALLNRSRKDAMSFLRGAVKDVATNSKTLDPRLLHDFVFFSSTHKASKPLV